jgi:hypothetical protein
VDLGKLCLGEVLDPPAEDDDLRIASWRIETTSRPRDSHSSASSSAMRRSLAPNAVTLSAPGQLVTT